MSTICADAGLLKGVREDLVASRTASRHATVEARTRATGARPARGRHEDYERRSTALGDLLGGQVFPRRF